MNGETRGNASILLVGNELLSGRVRDENLHFLAAELWQLGVAVRHVEICRDDVDDIAAAVARLAVAHTWLFTTGGIGPTHDDVTIEGIARAFGLSVVPHTGLESMIRSHFAEEVSPAHLRMACAPEGAGLEGTAAGAWPTIRVRNVFILPGVPWILRRKFERLRELFRQPPFHRRTLAFRVEEARLAPMLAQAACEFPTVEIGSYPEADCVLVTFESADAEAVEAARSRVEAVASAFPRA